MVAKKHTKPRSRARSAAPAPDAIEHDAPIDEAVLAEPARYTWQALEKKIPAPTEDERETFAVAMTASELTVLGASVRSERVLTDGLRWLGQIYDYWRRLSPRERKECIGFSEARLRATHAHFRALHDALAQSKPAPSARVDHARVVVDAERAYKVGQQRRRRLVLALSQAALSDRSLAAQIAAANGAAKDAVALYDTLAALVTLARALLKDPRSPVARALTADGVTPEWLDALDATATEIKATDTSQRGARSGAAVPQSELDRLDGVCLVTMAHLRKVFNAAREEDPRAPNLVPLATRGILGRREGTPDSHDTDEAKTP